MNERLPGENAAAYRSRMETIYAKECAEDAAARRAAIEQGIAEHNGRIDTAYARYLEAMYAGSPDKQRLYLEWQEMERERITNTHA